jgi:uncharacterized protein YdhG (YjbR/CyaY superfamily)
MKTTASEKKSAKRSGDGVAQVEKYLAAVPEPAQSSLRAVRKTIRSVVPAETTEGLSYGIPAFKYRGWLVGYGAFAEHCSLFPMSSALLEEFKKELKGFGTSKGTIRFPLDKPLPSALVRKLVRARIAKMDAKKKR